MKKWTFFAPLLIASSFLLAQAKDSSTNSSYELGKKVGSYLPAVILLLLAIWTINYFIRKSKR